MIRLLYFFLGYKRYTLKDEDVKKAAAIFLSARVNVKFYGSSFFVPITKTKSIEALILNKIEYESSSVLGVGGFIYRNRKRYGAFLSMLLCLFLFIFLSNVVWDVRIEGSDIEREEEIIDELKSCGFGVGSIWSEIDKSKVEVEMLSKSDLVSWININRRGTVAYVEVINKVVYENKPSPAGYANVIAACDAVIDEITVVHGFAVVKEGDSVKKGDLLISGIIPGELGGGFCYAEGYVKGRVSDTVSVSVGNSKKAKKYENDKITSVSLKIFNFSINIFKSYRNLERECDIIETEKEFDFFGVAKLPFSIVKNTASFYTVENVELTYEEMTETARKALLSELEKRLADSTLVKIRTEGEFSDSSYEMRSYIVCTEEIGKTLAFGAE